MYYAQVMLTKFPPTYVHLFMLNMLIYTLYAFNQDSSNSSETYTQISMDLISPPQKCGCCTIMWVVWKWFIYSWWNTTQYCVSSFVRIGQSSYYYSHDKNSIIICNALTVCSDILAPWKIHCCSSVCWSTSIPSIPVYLQCNLFFISDNEGRWLVFLFKAESKNK